MAKKNKRWNLRVGDELEERTKNLAYNLGISKNEVIENAVWSYVLDYKRFAKCPECQLPIFEKERMLIGGVGGVECKNGHQNAYDFDEDKFLSKKEKEDYLKMIKKIEDNEKKEM